ncbi:MAG: UvrB/UvrC motif-containing protein [Acidobacteria bacterium]|nr:UvrB/UvrC motif-containing protein [Acidobacteriota bacterium]
MAPDEGGSAPRAKSRPRKEQSPELADLPKPILEALRDPGAQLDQLVQAKEQAVADQDFEKAARLRDEEDVLKKQRANTLRTWEGKKTERVWEFDFLFPLHGADGAAVSAEKLAQLREQLNQRFGGVAELRHRVEGTWEIGGVALRGEVVALRVFAHQSGRATLFLTQLKEELKEEWGLRDILVLMRKVEVL